MDLEKSINKCKWWNLDYFWDIYDKYVRKIYDFIYYRTLDKEISEDLVGDIFLKIIKNFDSFSWNTEKDLSNWMYRIAHNTLIDYYRTNKAELQLDEIWDIPYEKNLTGYIDNNSKLDEVLNYLERIDKSHKDILIMRIWDDLSYKEISEITWKSVDNCKKIVSRVISQLESNIAFLFIILLIR